jgi:hypothetical protein
MKPMLIVASLILVAGLYMEYQKDSSFASVDTGSLVIGVGVGTLVCHFIG